MYFDLFKICIVFLAESNGKQFTRLSELWEQNVFNNLNI